MKVKAKFPTAVYPSGYWIDYQDLNGLFHSECFPSMEYAREALDQLEVVQPRMAQGEK